MEFRQLARSTISGSRAAFSMTVVPFARVAAIIRFSVPVTVTCCMTRWVPASRRAVAWMKPFSRCTSAPIRTSPSRCRLTGRDPIAQPPGRDTVARPKRVSRGPSTRIEARIVRTSSWGAVNSRMFAQFAWISMRSSRRRSAPMRPSSSMVVVMSCRWGRFPTVMGLSASRVAARIGSAAFFAPEVRISPRSGTPPETISLSTGGCRRSFSGCSRPTVRASRSRWRGRGGPRCRSSRGACR